VRIINSQRKGEKKKKMAEKGKKKGAGFSINARQHTVKALGAVGLLRGEKKKKKRKPNYLNKNDAPASGKIVTIRNKKKKKKKKKKGERGGGKKREEGGEGEREPRPRPMGDRKTLPALDNDYHRHDFALGEKGGMGGKKGGEGGVRGQAVKKTWPPNWPRLS